MEKPWWRSKKFIAFFLMEAAMLLMAVLALKWQENLGWPLAAFMVSIVFVMGFIAISFNGQQASLDMFVRGMALTGGISTKFKEKFKDVIPEKGE
jgi:hypothetical protein